MSLAHRVIPILLKRGNSLVKGNQFNSQRVVGHPLQAARVHSAREVDELMLLDIGCDKPDFKMVEKLTQSCFMPVTVGGGVSSLQDVRDLFNAGADKVAICSGTDLLAEAAGRFGEQAFVGVFNLLHTSGNWLQYIPKHCGEILFQSVYRDGMMEGYDLDSIRLLSEAINIPVIASCGCGTYQHMVEAVEAGASAVAAGAFFQFTDNTPKGAAEYLTNHGIEART